MAELTRTFHWERFAPNVGDNLSFRVQDQLRLEVAVGLTVVDLMKFHAGLKVVRDTTKPEPAKDAPADFDHIEQQLRPAAEALAKEWGPFVRLVGSHSLNGKPLATLADYLVRTLAAPGLFNVLEVMEKVDYLNSIRGTRELFSGALSGGSSSTEEQSSAPSESRTAAPSSGSPTSA